MCKKPEITVGILVEEAKIRCLQIMIFSIVLWMVFIIIGLNIIHINEKPSILILNEGPYKVDSEYYSNHKGPITSKYILKGNGITLNLENTRHEKIYVNKIQSAKVIVDRNPFYRKYYFMEFTYYTKPYEGCTNYLPRQCGLISQEEKIIVPIDAINRDIMQTFRVMFSIFFGLWLFGVSLGLFNKIYS